MIGRIDVHSHLLPGVDDGCKDLEDSLASARMLVENGYTHCFCTPHIWSSYPGNTAQTIPQMTADLQAHLQAQGIPLTLLPGGEMNVKLDRLSPLSENIVSYGMNNKFCLIDLWAKELPESFTTAVKWLQSHGLTVILAHPERMRAVQDQPELADYFSELGVLLQGNLQCFGDPPKTDTRRIAERFLEKDRYFLLGSDLHGVSTLPIRMAGLQRVREAVGDEKLNELTITHPGKLLPDAALRPT